MENVNLMLEKLSYSKFRSSFKLSKKLRDYTLEKGMDTIKKHAYDLIKKNLFSKYIPNDGRQTPMKGHPVFIAQHATATCCRKCLYKWYKIPENRELTNNEIDYIVSIILKWIELQMRSCQKKNICYN